MVDRAAKFTFPPEWINEPILSRLGQRFEVVTSTRTAGIDGDKG
jgi:hypothetical protein